MYGTFRVFAKYDKGVHTTNLQHRISLYADDILLCLQHPSPLLKETTSLKSLITLNWNKPTRLPLSEDAWDSAEQNSYNNNNNQPFALATLDTWVLIYSLGRQSCLILTTVENDLRRWMNLPLSKAKFKLSILQRSKS